MKRVLLQISINIHKPLRPQTTSDREKVETTIEAPQAILVISITPSYFISVSIDTRNGYIHSYSFIYMYTYIYTHMNVYKSIFLGVSQKTIEFIIPNYKLLKIKLIFLQKSFNICMGRL